ncbi:acyl carrier protein [Atopobacter sp. AH10]|uniref:acyl carrier protein n=1 Tax=Atopobacter sp. AH10 TaxID=2315861 RepID=UPI000EF1F86E|nr:acyl carrier protein [Atopobacter sp. AH10]RLK63292.1 acyl carrier protein [Atopobacter sp. AH10]
MTEEEIFNRLSQLIAEHFDMEAGQLSESTRLDSDLEADSLDIVEVVMAVEDEFAIEIPDEEAEKMLTVGDAVRFISDHVK